MPSRFDLPSGSESEPEPHAPEKGIDGSKRYDVYCTYLGTGLVVYRNVLIKRMTPLLAKDTQYARIGDFVELEAPDGHSFFICRLSLTALCEQGKTLPVEAVLFK